MFPRSNSRFEHSPDSKPAQTKTDTGLRALSTCWIRTCGTIERRVSIWKENNMQSVNGVDQGHPAAPEIPQPTENSGEPIQFPQEMKTKLKEPLPTEAVSPNPLKPGLSAIKVIYVVERLNDV